MSSKKAIIYIHIGTIKTGTTSLQHFFHLNRSNLLKSHRLYYPKSPGYKNHTKLPLYAFDKNLAEMRIRHGIKTEVDLAKFRKDFKSKFIAEIKPQLANGNDILVSSEHLSSRAMYAQEIKNLIALFEGLNCLIKIIVYLRPQDKMMLSTYSTWVKSGGKWNLNPNAYKNRRYDHLSMLDLWASVVGKEHMIVKVFEKSKMKDGDLFTDFCSTLRIASLQNLKIPAKDKLNSSLDTEHIQFLKLFNKFIPTMSKTQTNLLRGRIVEYLEEFSGSDKLDISLEEKNKIYNYFESDNNTISAKYLNSNLPLFDPITKSDSYQEPIKLSTEKAIEIASYLWMKQQGEIEKNKNLFSIKSRIKKILGL